MTKRQMQRAIERHVADRFPDLAPVGDLLIARNGPVLHGFLFNRSQMDKYTFRLVVFAQVLSIPTDAIDLTLSSDLGDFHIDSDEEPAFTSAAAQATGPGRRFLARASDCRSVIANLASIVASTGDERLARESRCHCLVVCGEEDEALRELHDLTQAFARPEVPYEQEAAARLRSLHSALRKSHRDGTALLAEWTRQTSGALGISVG